MDASLKGRCETAGWDKVSDRFKSLSNVGSGEQIAERACSRTVSRLF